MSDDLQPKPWMRTTLCLAGIYNLTWGLWVVIWPVQSQQVAGLNPPIGYPQIWQCLGMVIGLYGIGYLLAAREPFRHWPIVLIGLMGKVFGPVGFAWHLFHGALPSSMAWMLIFNDLIWWPAFSLILWHAIRRSQAEGTVYLKDEFDDPFHDLLTSVGKSVSQLSFTQTQLVVFLRHSGCTFCRETLSDLQRQREQIEGLGCGIVLIHLGNEDRAAQFFQRYGLGDVPRLSDPECRLYRQFGLEHGQFMELLGPRVMLRGLISAIFGGHGFGFVQGNGFQMPGAFLVENGQFLSGFQHTCASDRVDFVKFLQQTKSESHERVSA